MKRHLLGRLSITATLMATLGSGAMAQTASDLRCSQCVHSSDVATGAITSGEIRNGTILEEDLANSAVTSRKIRNGTIHSADIRDGTVSGADIRNGSVGTSDLANGAVTSAKIRDGNVLQQDLGNNAVTSAKIRDGHVTNADLANGAVNSAKIEDGSIRAQDLHPDAFSGYVIENGTVTSSIIQDGAVANADLADGAVDSAKVQDGSIRAQDLHPDAFSGYSLPTGSVTSSAIQDGAVSNADLADGAVNSAKVEDGSIGPEDLRPGAFTAISVEDDSIDSNHLMDGAVTLNVQALRVFDDDDQVVGPVFPERSVIMEADEGIHAGEVFQLVVSRAQLLGYFTAYDQPDCTGTAYLIKQPRISAGAGGRYEFDSRDVGPESIAADAGVMPLALVGADPALGADESGEPLRLVALLVDDPDAGAVPSLSIQSVYRLITGEGPGSQQALLCNSFGATLEAAIEVSPASDLSRFSPPFRIALD